jgi:asparagine synthetase A
VHGLNGDILVWNHVTGRRHELTSMGVRVNDKTLRQQLEMTGQLDFLNYPYHRAILNHELPLSIGGGIVQSRTLMFVTTAEGALRRGERHCLAEHSERHVRARKNIFVLE